MKPIQFTAIQRPTLQVRNNRDQLIADIVEATTETNKTSLAKLIAIRARELKWTDQDLHALLAKKNDPKIRNYTAFLKWSLKTKSI